MANQVLTNMVVILSFKSMRILIAFLFFSITTFGQTFSESDIKDFAKLANKEVQGVDIGNNITVMGCISVGRNLIYQYQVPEYWEPVENIKKELISNLKVSGAAKTYFLYGINVQFFYYKGSSLIKKVTIKSNEFSTFNFKLGEYLSIKGHSKSKEVNLKIKPPIGWKIKEGNGPNIIKKFIFENNIYSVSVKNLSTFYSKKQSKEIFNDKEFVNGLQKECTSFLQNSEILSKKIITVGGYPAFEMKFKGTKENSGINIPMVGKFWYIIYEDKVVWLQASGVNNSEFKALEQLYLLITNSVSFPEQYN